MKIFIESSKLEDISYLAKDSRVNGFILDSSSLKEAKIENYQEHVKTIMAFLSQEYPSKGLCIQTFADDLDSLRDQTFLVFAWAKRYDIKTYLRMPITNTIGITNVPLLNGLSNDSARCNPIGITSQQQIIETLDCINLFVPALVSISASQVSDTGVDPEEIIRFAADYYGRNKNPSTKIEFMWESMREPFNYIQAKRSGCDVISMKPDMLDTLQKMEYNLNNLSLDIIKQSYKDCKEANIEI